MAHSPLTSVELFTGAGGLALGVAAAGFSHRLLLEYNRDALRTIKTNREVFGTGCQIYEEDVAGYDFTALEGTHLLAAGAPCQPFSIGGKHRAHKDERNLFPQVFRAVREVRPQAIIVENVKGLLRSSLSDFVEFVTLQLEHPLVLPSDPLDPDSWSDHLPALRSARDQGTDKSDLQYFVTPALLNAANYGVPQCRERVFLVAFRTSAGVRWTPPLPTHSREALLLAQEVTGAYWKDHGIKRKVLAGHPLAGKWQREGGRTDRWRTVRDALDGLPKPVRRRSADGWFNHIRQPGARCYAGHTGSPLDAPAKAIKAGVHGVPGGENMLRYPNGAVRYFTVREAARLQTFPDSYIFEGAWGETMRQIGNAVPVKLAEVVASSVRQYLEQGASGAPAALKERSRLRDLQLSFVQPDVPELVG